MHTTWKPRYDRDKKFHEAMQKLKSTLHLASRGEWQLDYEIQGELRQYLSSSIPSICLTLAKAVSIR
jgi:hypothetical protein